MFLAPLRAGVAERTVEFCMKSFQNVTPVLRNYSIAEAPEAGAAQSTSSKQTHTSNARAFLAFVFVLFFPPFNISPIYSREFGDNYAKWSCCAVREWHVFPAQSDAVCAYGVESSSVGPRRSLHNAKKR